MAFTHTKTTVVNTNPVDRSTQTTIDVTDVHVNGKRTKEGYSFADGTADATISTTVHDDLVAKGYPGVDDP